MYAGFALRYNRYHRSGTYFLDPLYDDPFTGGETRRHQPPVADRPVEIELALLNGVLRIYDKSKRVPLGVAGHRLLRNQDRSFSNAIL